MGFDVTFHPVSVADLQRFVFDVADDGKLAAARAKEITKSPAKQAEVAEGVLTRLPAFVTAVKEDGGFANRIAFAASAVAGYLHPFWYARGSALSFLIAKHPEVGTMLTSLTKVAKGSVAKLKDDSQGAFTGNYTASGVVVAKQIPKLRALVEKLATAQSSKKPAPIFESFDEEGLDSLRRALAYAEAHGLGLMEATDVVVPISDESFTDSDNLRAHFLKNEGHAKVGAAPAKKKAAAKKKTAAKKKAAPAKKKTAAKRR